MQLHDKCEGPRRSLTLYQEPIFSPAQATVAPEIKPGEVIVTKVAPAELEKMLKNQYGNQLEPIKKGKKPPAYKFHEMNPRKQKELKAAREAAKKSCKAIELAMLRPKHLTAVRFRELFAAGRTMDEIYCMYNFGTMQYFRTVLKRIGCGEFVRPGGRPKKDIKKDRCKSGAD